MAGKKLQEQFEKLMARKKAKKHKERMERWKEFQKKGRKAMKEKRKKENEAKLAEEKERKKKELSEKRRQMCLARLEEKRKAGLEAYWALYREEHMNGAPKGKKRGRKKKRGPKPKESAYMRRKKKNTPPKKRGPQPKPKVKIEKPKIKYKVVWVKNGQQYGRAARFLTLPEAMEYMRKQQELDKLVVFEKTVMNTMTNHEYNYREEYLLMEKDLSNTKTTTELFRNEFGKLTPVEINMPPVVEGGRRRYNWVLIDKIQVKAEETFWVYGIGKLGSERKTFMWVFDNLIKDAISTKYDLVRIYLFKNKIIIKYDTNDIELILCKIPSDAIKFYNLIETYKNKEKLKQVFMCGPCDDRKHPMRETIINDIQEKTGWTSVKICLTRT